MPVPGTWTRFSEHIQNAEWSMLTAWCLEPKRNFLVDLVQNTELEEELPYEVLSRTGASDILDKFVRQRRKRRLKLWLYIYTYCYKYETCISVVLNILMG